MQLVPQDLRGTAGALGRLSGEADEARRQLSHSWNRLDGGWEWYAAEDINGHYGRAMNLLDRMVAVLREMGEALVKTADLIEQADLAAAGLFRDLGFQVEPDSSKLPGLANLGVTDNPADTADRIIKRLAYSIFDWSVDKSDEEEILRLFNSAVDVPAVIREIDKRGMLDELFNRVDIPANRRDLLRLLGSGLEQSAEALVMPHIIRLGIGAELQYNLGKLGIGISTGDFDASSYADIISSDPSKPFTGVGATGHNPTAQGVPPGDQFLLLIGDDATEAKYSNPLGSLDVYLNSLTDKDRQRQVELLVGQPISTVEANLYAGQMPLRQQIIQVAADKYNLDPNLLTAFILAEQRDQTRLEDAKDYVAAVSLAQGNTSIGLGQVVITTAQNNDLFSDLLSEQTRKNLGHNGVAKLLASDEFNIFAAAKYIRTVADQGASIDIATIPDTKALFPGLDLAAYAKHSTTWPEDNIRALASEYTTPAWDNGDWADSPGWGYFVFEAYRDSVNSQVFP